MLRYSSTINAEIKTASQTISIALTSMVASVSVSNCAGGRPVTATPPSALRREEVNALNKVITTFAASRLIKCDLSETLFNSSLTRFCMAATSPQQTQIIGFEVHALFRNLRHGYFRKHGTMVYDADGVRDFG